MTAPETGRAVPADDDDRIDFSPEGIFRLTEGNQDFLDQWHGERGMETSRAHWKKRALAAEARLASLEAERAVLPRAGGVMKSLYDAMPNDCPCLVADLLTSIRARGVVTTRKEVYNAIGYMNRKGIIEKVRYGQYRRAALASEKGGPA